MPQALQVAWITACNDGAAPFLVLPTRVRIHPQNCGGRTFSKGCIMRREDRTPRWGMKSLLSLLVTGVVNQTWKRPCRQGPLRCEEEQSSVGVPAVRAPDYASGTSSSISAFRGAARVPRLSPRISPTFGSTIHWRVRSVGCVTAAPSGKFASALVRCWRQGRNPFRSVSASHALMHWTFQLEPFHWSRS